MAACAACQGGSPTSFAPGRRIVLLTVFRKTRQRERAEIDRAWQAMRVCMNDHLEEMQ
jgi:16S rRNA C1402 N4-methylase RsmH